jgi:hypothetical protein
MIRVQPKFAKLVSAKEHPKAERIFSNVKNIAFRHGLQAGRELLDFYGGDAFELLGDSSRVIL